MQLKVLRLALFHTVVHVCLPQAVFYTAANHLTQLDSRQPTTANFQPPAYWGAEGGRVSGPRLVVQQGKLVPASAPESGRGGGRCGWGHDGNGDFGGYEDFGHNGDGHLQDETEEEHAENLVLLVKAYSQVAGVPGALMTSRFECLLGEVGQGACC